MNDLRNYDTARAVCGSLGQYDNVTLTTIQTTLQNIANESLVANNPQRMLQYSLLGNMVLAEINRRRDAVRNAPAAVPMQAAPMNLSPARRPPQQPVPNSAERKMRLDEVLAKEQEAKVGIQPSFLELFNQLKFDYNEFLNYTDEALKESRIKTLTALSKADLTEPDDPKKLKKNAKRTVESLKNSSQKRKSRWLETKIKAETELAKAEADLEFSTQLELLLRNLENIEIARRRRKKAAPARPVEDDVEEADEED